MREMLKIQKKDYFLLHTGNATVLVALLMAKGRKSRMNFFIKHLAAAGTNNIDLQELLIQFIMPLFETPRRSLCGPHQRPHGHHLENYNFV